MTRSLSTTDARCCSSTTKYPRRSRTRRSTSRSAPTALISWSGDSRTTRPHASHEGWTHEHVRAVRRDADPGDLCRRGARPNARPNAGPATGRAELAAPGRDDAGPEAEDAGRGSNRNVDPSRRAITLSDGTKLVTPVGAVLKPGVVTDGMFVVASYREENGAKVVTGLRRNGAPLLENPQGWPSYARQNPRAQASAVRQVCRVPNHRPALFTPTRALDWRIAAPQGRVSQGVGGRGVGGSGGCWCRSSV